MFEECRLEGEFALSSGKKSPYFYDFDLLSSKDLLEYADKLTALIPQEVRDEIDFIAAPVLGGVELAYVVAGILSKPRVKVYTVMFEVRGPKFKGKKYLIVDDVVSTFKTVEGVEEALQENKCIGVAALIYRGDEGNKPCDFPCYYLEAKEEEK